MGKNVGTIDAVIRFVLGAYLAYLGLFQLGGTSGNLTGIIVALVALVLFYTAAARKCPIFKLLGISSAGKG